MSVYALFDRVHEFTSVTGTGSATPTGAFPGGFATFSSRYSAGDTMEVLIRDLTTFEWEVSSGTWNGTTYTRTTVLSSSTGSAVSFAAGSKEMLVVDAAAKRFISRIVSVTVSSDQTDFNPTGWTISGGDQAQGFDINCTVTSKINSLAGGEIGRRATFRNSGVAVIIIPNEDTSGTASMRFAGTFPTFLVPGDIVWFAYGADNRWHRVNGETNGSDFDLWEDFDNVPGSLTQVLTSGGTLASSTTGVGDATLRVVGSALFGVSATTDRSAIRLGAGTPIIPSVGVGISLHRVSIATLNNGTNDVSFRCGFGDSEAAAVDVAGAYWVYKTGDTHWQFGVADASTPSDTATTITVNAGDFYWLGVVKNADGSRYTFFSKVQGSDWVINGSKTTGLPTTNMQAHSVLAKTAGGTARFAREDVQAVRYSSTFQRG